MTAKTFPEIMVFFDKQPLSYPMRLIHSDPVKDVAILKCQDSAWDKVLAVRECRLSFAEPVVGDAVNVVGYPNYTDGATCLVYPGNITGYRIVGGQRFFSVSQHIVKGNSGGPVVDELGQVIGIATLGVDADDVANLAYNGCIPLHSIDRIIALVA